MNTFQLTVSSPDGNAFKGEVARLSVRGLEGDLAVMAGHIPFLTVVKPGEIHITEPDGTVLRGQTGGGLLTVGQDGTVLLGSLKLEK